MVSKSGMIDQSKAISHQPSAQQRNVEARSSFELMADG